MKLGRDYKKIRAWQIADKLAIEVYKLTREFPRSEQFGLVAQMRRAAVSVAANIVEGASRRHTREYLQFLYVSLGSLNELEYYFRFSKEVEYIRDGVYEDMINKCEKAIKTLRGLISYIEGGRDGKNYR